MEWFDFAEELDKTVVKDNERDLGMHEFLGVEDFLGAKQFLR